MNASFTKVKDAQPVGIYTPTILDKVKEQADFRIIQVAPIYIAWRDGRKEIVSSAKLKRLQKQFTWVTDF